MAACRLHRQFPAWRCACIDTEVQKKQTRTGKFQGTSECERQACGLFQVRLLPLLVR